MMHQPLCTRSTSNAPVEASTPLCHASLLLAGPRLDSSRISLHPLLLRNPRLSRPSLPCLPLILLDFRRPSLRLVVRSGHGRGIGYNNKI